MNRKAKPTVQDAEFEAESNPSLSANPLEPAAESKAEIASLAQSPNSHAALVTVGEGEHPVLRTVAERIEYVTGLMETLRWNPDTSGKLQKELAALWGVSRSAVRQYSSQAHRNVVEMVRGRSKEAAEAALDSLLVVAKDGATSTIPGDKSAAVKAAERLLMFAGIDKPESDKVQKVAVANVEPWWVNPDKSEGGE